MDLLDLAFDDHTGRGLRGARGDELAIDFDETDQAGRQRPAFLQVAQRRDVDADLARGLQHGLSRLQGDGLPVDGDVYIIHNTSMALWGQTWRHVSQRVQRFMSIWWR